MLNWLLSFLISTAFAQAVPVITAPTGIIIVPSVARTMTGISVTVAGATALTQFTMTFDCSACVLTATGTNVSGSGSSHLSIGPDIATQLNSALATLQVVFATAVLNARDKITINAVSGGQNAIPVPFAIVVDGNKYLVQTTPADALTRAQTQCAALGCDGTFTKYWWTTTTNTDGTGAIKIVPGDKCYDKTYTASCGTGTVGTGLSGAEQAALVPATSVALPLPVEGLLGP